MAICVDSPVVEMQGEQAEVLQQRTCDIEDPLLLLDQGTRSLFRQLQWQVLHEARTGGPPRLLCMLAYLTKMPARERERIMQIVQGSACASSQVSASPQGPSAPPGLAPPGPAQTPPAPPRGKSRTLLQSPPGLQAEAACSTPPGLEDIPPAGRVPSATESIGGLVRMCFEGTPKSCAGAAFALGQLASLSPESRSAIGQIGGVSALVQLLQMPCPEAHVPAVGALLSLVEGNVDNQAMLVRTGGVTILLKLASASGAPDEMCAHVARTISLIAKGNKMHGIAVSKLGALPMLVGFMKDASSAACECAVFALRYLALCSSENQLAVGRAGAVLPLVHLLQTSTPEVRGYCAGALATLAEGCPENQAVIVAAGGITPLVSLLECGVPDSCRRAASALANIAIHSEEHRALIAGAGAVPGLIRLASDSMADGQSHGEAAYTLMCLAWRSLDSQSAIVRGGGVDVLVRSLREHRSPLARGYAAGALGSLAECNPESSAAIAEAGGIIALTALAREGNPKACRYAIAALRHFVVPCVGQTTAV